MHDALNRQKTANPPHDHASMRRNVAATAAQSNREDAPLVIEPEETETRRTLPMTEGTPRVIPVVGSVTDDEIQPTSRRMTPLPPFAEFPQPTIRLDAARLPIMVHRILKDSGDDFRLLAGALAHRIQKHELKTLMLTGCLPEEGYTTVTLALATALSRWQSLRVLVVDGDLTKAGLTRALRLRPAVGLQTVLHGQCTLAQAMVRYENPPLFLLPSRPRRNDSEGSIPPQAVGQMLDAIREIYDIVLVDAGCVFGSRKPVLWAAGVDAALLVRQPSRSTESLLEQADEFLLDRGIECLGVIENGVEEMRAAA